jgi:catalase
MGEIWPVLGRQVGIVVGEDVDAQTVKTLQELLRAAAPIGVVGDGGVALEPSDVAARGPGVVQGDGDAVVEELLELLSLHRVWDRFGPVASAAISS